MAKDHGKTLAEWDFPEFISHQRNKGWYIWGFIIVILLLIYSLVTVNFLFAVIIIIATITILIKNQDEPTQITFIINEDGIELEDKLHEFDKIRNFYIIYKPPEIKNLYIDFKSFLKPRLIIPLENQNPLKIREILTQYIDEDIDKEEEPISEVLRKTFKL